MLTGIGRVTDLVLVHSQRTNRWDLEESTRVLRASKLTREPPVSLEYVAATLSSVGRRKVYIGGDEVNVDGRGASRETV